MRELLAELFIPALGARYDVSIPAAGQIHEITALLLQAVERLSAGRFQAVDPVLCDGASGAILDGGKTVEELGLQNGARLMLI
ncbi:MAG: EsaB/YukD family protein [Oscillospiraceae bacterium]|jgi:hypothetical protein|nr:EsaB/YukD family protein [Oscillospiraceae bacterium]